MQASDAHGTGKNKRESRDVTHLSMPHRQVRKGEIMMTNYRYGSITEISELIRQKQISPVELVAGCLERIEHLQPQLNAFITMTADQALQEAKLAERAIQNGTWKGPLHGIPVGIKDFFDTAGIRTTAACAALKDRVP